MADVQAKTTKIGLLQQAKGSNHWAAPAAANAAFQTIICDSPPGLPDTDTQMDEFNWTSSSSISTEDSRILIDSINTLPSYPFSCVAMESVLAPFLVAAMQEVTEAAGTPFQKDFNIPTTVLDFSNNEGYLHTIAIDYINGTDGVILENALLNELTFTVNNLGRGAERLMKLSGTWVGNEMNDDQDLSGSWVAAPTSGFYGSASGSGDTLSFGTFTLGTDYSGICWHRFSLTINNNVVVNCRTAGGKASNYTISPEVTGVIDLVYNSTSFDAFGKYKDGTPLVFTLDTGANGNQLLFTVHEAYLTAQPRAYEGDYHALSLQFKVVYDTSNTESLEIMLIDTIDWAY